MAAQPRGWQGKARGCLSAILVLLAVTSTGCTSLGEWWHNGFKVGPNYQKPPAPVAEEWIDAKAEAINPAPANLHDWWTWFGDPKLNELVETAYRQNLDLRTAGARVLEARALRNIAAGNLFPQTQQAFGEYQRIGISAATAQFNQGGFGGLPGFPGGGFGGFNRFFDQWNVGFNLSWELDVWGRYRRAIEAGNADLDASIEGYDDVLVLLIADVAGAYVQIRTFQKRIEYAEANIRAQEDYTKKAEERKKGGLKDAEIDFPQLRSQLENTRALKEQLEFGLRQANNRLCILLGIPPRDLTKELGEAPIPGAPPQLVVGVPANLLRRRPDIRSAERQVAAQSARIGVAVSDLYPRFTIIGTMGWQAEEFGDLVSPRSFYGNIGPSLRWDILNYGRLLNNIRVQDARFQQAVLNYQSTVLNAGREAEDGMVAFIKARLRTDSLRGSTEDAEEVVRILNNRLFVTFFDINRLFTATNFLTQQQDQLAQAQGDIALAMIQTYRALGGGWEIRLKDLPNGANCAPPMGPGAPLVIPGPGVETLPLPEPVPNGKGGNTAVPSPATIGVPQGLPEWTTPAEAKKE